jgi:hypothetical protein
VRKQFGSLPTRILLDVQAAHLSDCCDLAISTFEDAGLLKESERAGCAEALAAAVEAGPSHHSHHVAVVAGQHSGIAQDCAVLMRVAKPIEMFGEPTGEGIWFAWIVLSAAHTHSKIGTVAEFVHLASESHVFEQFLTAGTPNALRETYIAALHQATHFEGHIPDELRPSGRLGGGFVNDIKRRLPHYASDYIDGLNGKSLASILFLYFACLAPAIAFGGLLASKTNGEVGAIEMIVATAICGIVYALFAGQPLTILGSTGPVIIFMGILFELCQQLQLPFLPTTAWVGLWTTTFLLILAFTDASCWIRYFTRFTDDTFAALIALIFVYEAAASIAHGFADPGTSDASALLSLNLALGTFFVAGALRRFRQSPYMIARVREFFADFGPAIAIAVMAVAAWLMGDVPLQTLQVPDSLSTSSGRPWLVNPFEAPKWVWGAAALPAMLVSILLYLDQNITVRLVNNAEYKLKKGAGYHLDLALVGVLVGVCSMLGLPWMVAATVRSLNHVRSLATTTGEPGQETVVSVVETRVSGLGVHLLVALSLLALPLLKVVPMSVLFGLFLFMGISAMTGNQFFERIRLWAMDRERYPPTYYLRAVPKPVVHTFTVIQALCLAVLWIVKTSAVGILFPLFIGLLVPVRVLMGRFFDEEHLALLDAEEEPDEEMDREGA